MLLDWPTCFSTSKGGDADLVKRPYGRFTYFTELQKQTKLANVFSFEFTNKALLSAFLSRFRNRSKGIGWGFLSHKGRARYSSIWLNPIEIHTRLLWTETVTALEDKLPPNPL